MAKLRISSAATLSFLLCAGSAAAQSAKAPASTQQRTSTSAEQKAVSLTVYNQNFGLVRELREVENLGTGRVALEFRDVASTIQPETVHIRALGAANTLSVLEQSYRYDLLTPSTLLEKYVGRPVRVHRYHERLGKEEAIDAELLSVAESPVLKLNGEITFGYPGRLSFSELPPNLIAKPTLLWLLESRRPKQTLEVTYLARNMSWSADYVLVVSENEQKGDLTGWVTLVNQSGASYRNAELKLVAGTVNRVEPPRDTGYGYSFEEKAAAVADGGFSQENLFEYHMYTLGRPTTVLDKEQKQVTLLEASGIGVQKKLVFTGQPYFFRGQYGQLESNQKLGVFLEIVNDGKSGLGMPLPKGTLRVYKADRSGAKQFVGEDAIEHTPRDETFRVKLGEAFDVVGDRKQMQWRALGNCSSESAWEIELRNHKDAQQEVEVQEPVGGDWTILSSSHPAVKKDAHTFTFKVLVPARGKTKISYRLQTRWC